MQHPDTIVAPATPQGRGAIAVIRLSGPAAHDAVAALAGGPLAADRRMRLRVLRNPSGGGHLDEALTVLFPAASSPTGEVAAELHLHGGVAVVNAVMAALLAMPGLRLAEPGEFARRAVIAGRMDLTQAEGLADLIDAETEAQRLQAARLMQGALRDRATAWRDLMIEARGLFEASIDFADEGEISDAAVEQAQRVLIDLMTELDAALAGGRAAEITRQGFEVVLIGRPNAGKSSLLNTIAGREVALTSAIPGTTRDAIEVRCSIGGRLVVLVDTAGQRETEDPIEAAGVDWSRRRAAAGDLRLVISAPDAPWDAEVPAGDIAVWNKADVRPGPGLNVSARTGQGVDALLAAIEVALVARVGIDAVATRRRHFDAIASARDHVQQAMTADAELAAEHLRLASMALGRLIGVIDPESVLDEIFSRFCLGK
ncbi:MAG: tRNA uridine-5-carboxymethylaminomethyl(34) synthesis GTPase MnmE [Rubrimonas sp.]